MKGLFLLLIVILLCCRSFSQVGSVKPPIDSSVYGRWPSVESPAITDDGKYTMYTIENQPNGRETLMIQSVAKKWKKAFSGISSWNAKFTRNSRLCIIFSFDSLSLIALGTNSVNTLHEVESYSISNGRKHQWLAYLLKNDQKLVIRNLENGNEQSFLQVKSYEFSKNGEALLLQSMKGNNIELRLVDLKSQVSTYIWEGSTVSDIVWHDTKTQLSFLAESNLAEKRGSNIWIFKQGETKATILRIESSKMRNNNVSTINRFSTDGGRLFVTLRELDTARTNSEIVSLNIWNYKDVKLQSQQLRQLDQKSYLYVIEINTGNIIRLEQENESFRFNQSNGLTGDKYGILEVNNGGDPSELWNAGNRIQYFIVSTTDGKRIRMPERGFLSPENKYYIFYDSNKNDYFSYEIATGTTRNITEMISVPWTMSFNSTSVGGDVVPNSGWLEDDRGVLLHDEFDIWQIDPLGKEKPIQLTKGIGKEHKIFFERIVADDLTPVKYGELLILSSFNRINKENGFYRVKIGDQNGLEKLSSERKVYYYANLGAIGMPTGTNMVPIKATNKDKYIVRCMSASQSPNFFVTTDFKSFSPISDIQPEKDYNWFTTELHSWKSPEGRSLQGVLYKPENFNPNKHYPIIFYYYEVLSDQLNCYLSPKPSDGRLNIAWYVSNEYLVFTPDIHYLIGNPFTSTYDCVVSAADYMSQYPFVNRKKMGIQGVSWGGIQTNYLVTHTNIFAAACSASSVSDIISNYNGLAQGDHSAQPKYENGQYRIGFTLWDRPEWFVKNSPIMNADKVTTPLLMFQTSVDHATRFEQAIEMFTALRRLRKKVWLLEYSDGEHSVSGRSARDFDLRMQQFFNYYLKDSLPPLWMTIGRKACFKSIYDCLELDTSGVVP